MDLGDNNMSTDGFTEEQEPARPPSAGKVRLPGYGMSITDRVLDDKDAEFPILVADTAGWKAHTLLIREYCMLEAVESLTNKPEWWRKIRDPEIAAKWRAEMLTMDWQLFHQHADFTPNMADAVSLLPNQTSLAQSYANALYSASRSFS